LGVVVARIRVQRERELEQMTVIAETAQRAVLRTMPTAVGSVGFAARYVSATEAALVGGDLYEVAETPYGVRVVVGDVRGKGLEAVQLAASVLGAFRRAVFAYSSLADVATDLDGVVRAIAGDEEFVTALLAEFHDDHSVTMVNCGHHPPMLVEGVRSAALLDTGDPEPPLGLGPTPRPVTCECAPGSRLLLYTDGLVETRDASGRFFPLSEHAWQLSQGSLDEALDVLVSDLAEFSGQRMTDDLALVLAERLPAG
jgi:serine phosphatase RsbU (regulator of sigma subunit)